MVTRSRVRKSRGSRKRFIGKPTGQVQERVQAMPLGNRRGQISRKILPRG